jgi:hypothetical protein
MEKHFLEGQFEGEPQEFKAEPWYNPHGDCIVYQIADEALVGERIDEVLTIYRSAIDNRPIGYQIKDVLAIIRRFGWDGLACMSETSGDEVTCVSVAALLLAAYEDGPKTTNRRTAYASVLKYGSDKPIRREQLVPA